MMSWNARLATVAVLLVATVLFLKARARDPFVPPRPSLSSFPAELGSWLGRDLPIPAEMRKILGPGEYLQRRYMDSARGQPDIDLYLAYLSNEHSLYSHLPQDCLTGSGWTTVQANVTTLGFPGTSPFEVNRYLISREGSRQLVLFWYWVHGRRVANEGRMNFYLIFDALRWNRSDSALIRINTALQPGEAASRAEQRLLSFAGLMNPLLKDYIPR